MRVNLYASTLLAVLILVHVCHGHLVLVLGGADHPGSAEHAAHWLSRDVMRVDPIAEHGVALLVASPPAVFVTTSDVLVLWNVYVVDDLSIRVNGGEDDPLLDLAEAVL